MSGFSGTRAALYGLGMIRRDPATFLSVSVLFGVFFVWMFLSVGGLYVQMLATMLHDMSNIQAITPLSMEINARLGLIYLMMIPLYAVTLAAMQRSMVHGRSDGWVLGLKLSMDEVRILLVTIVCYIIAFIPYFIAAIVGGLAGGVAAGLAAAAADPAGGRVEEIPWTVLVSVAAPVVLIGLGFSAWIGIRLSAAGAATIGEQRFVIFESWGITRGRFWSLFRAYLLLFAIIIAIEAVVVLIVIHAAAPRAAEFAVSGSVGPEAVLEFSFGPRVAAGGVLYALFVTFFFGAMLGIGAGAYKDWKQSQAASA